MFQIGTKLGLTVVTAQGRQLLPFGNYLFGGPSENKTIVLKDNRGWILTSEGIKHPLPRFDLENEYPGYFQEDLVPWRQWKSHFGYLDESGQWAIEPKFSRAFVFHNGLALAKAINNRLIAIDKSGATIESLSGLWLHGEDCQYIIPRNPLTFWAHTKMNGRWRYAIVKNFQIVKCFKAEIRDLREGVFAVETRGNFWQLYSSDGELIHDTGYDQIFTAWDGMIAVRAKNGKWGAIDTAGCVRVPLQFDKMDAFHGGFARAEKGNTKLVINRNGDPILKSTKSDFFVHACGIECLNPIGVCLLNWQGELLWKFPRTLKLESMELKFCRAKKL